MPATSRITASDGVALAVHEYGNPSAATILLVHGYPDTSDVWDGVVAQLSPTYHVVTFDVRGAGGSDKPGAVSAYRIEQLIADISAVATAVSPERAVHLVGHDWGSVQSWPAVTDERVGTQIASFTSISGPDLDQAGVWLRAQARPHLSSLRKLFTQLIHSAYIGLFLTPFVPELLWRTTLLDRIVGYGPTGTHTERINGLKLYRANIRRRFSAPAPARTQVPVQVIAPSRDSYVGVQLQTEAPAPWAGNLHTRIVAGSHWVPRTRPDVIARCIADLVEHVEGAPASRALVAAQRGGTPATIAKPFESQLVVITGAGSGIGAATALEFARAGADLVLADIDVVAARKTATAAIALGVQAWAYPLDVCDGAAFESFASQVQATHGTPDVMVNNAGIGMAGPFLDTSVTDWEQIIDVNLWGVIHGSRLFGAMLAQRGTGGRIVNIASAAAFMPSRTYPAYATTKAAVLMLSECLRAEFARDEIGVIAICPGFINTNITRSTVHVGLDQLSQERRRRQAVKSYGRRNYSPERAARHIVAATLRNTPVKTITLESKLFLGISRLTPGLARSIATHDLRDI